MIGNLYSMSFCSRRVLGDRVDAFERDIREALLAAEPSGILQRRTARVFRLHGVEALSSQGLRRSS